MGGAFGLGVRTVRAVDFLTLLFLTLLFAVDLDDARLDLGVAGAASPCGADAATHSARKPTSAIGPLSADTQIGLHLPEPVLYKLYSVPNGG